jgi:hypothetical protein
LALTLTRTACITILPSTFRAWWFMLQRLLRLFGLYGDLKKGSNH